MQYNMSPGVTPMSHSIYTLHMTVFWICVAIGVVVFGILLYSLIMHRKSRGHVAAHFHEHLVLEIVWAVIPFVILVILAIPATIVLMRMQDTGDADITIKITGYQWKWKYEYLDQGIGFFSVISTPRDQIYGEAEKGKHYLLEVDRPLVLPVQKKIRFLVTSNDVIHSWWVPALGVKRDAIPGYIHESWAFITTPGTYRGQCAELCGANHAFMPIVVKAVTQEAFEQWVAANGPTLISPSVPTMPMMLAPEILRKNCLGLGGGIPSSDVRPCTISFGSDTASSPRQFFLKLFVPSGPFSSNDLPNFLFMREPCKPTLFQRK